MHYKSVLAIGLMSGTSVDGLDIVLCSFRKTNKKWQWKLFNAETIQYSDQWKSRLLNGHLLDSKGLMLLNRDFGRKSAIEVSAFLKRTAKMEGVSKITPRIVASHGHTIFHNPEEGYTLQIGSGAEIAACTGITTVCDFRSLDIAMGGQGAPLVPVGDELLFPDYGYCLNLGGFANISYNNSNIRRAFDICPVNIIINHLAQKIGFAYDHNGEIAKSGKIDKTVLSNLENIDFYQRTGPRSLAREDVDRIYLPLLQASNLSIPDILRTYYEHTSLRIAAVIDDNSENKKVMATGGGANNKFLVQLISERLKKFDIEIPNEMIVNYKEAIIFALLGILRLNNENNTLASVTGAKRDSSGGTVYN